MNPRPSGILTIPLMVCKPDVLRPDKSSAYQAELPAHAVPNPIFNTVKAFDGIARSSENSLREF